VRCSSIKLPTAAALEQFYAEKTAQKEPEEQRERLTEIEKTPRVMIKIIISPPFNVWSLHDMIIH
jgi:hypothetical protein